MRAMTSTSSTNPYKGRTGLDRIVRAAGYSWAGLRSAVQHESAFRQEALLAIVMLPAAFWLGRSWTETVLLAASVVVVLVVELLNSAIEATIDRISYERHELARRAKDYGSAAVLLALLLAGGVWATALWQRFAA
jgi:diacylglycerol kinase (ATP)